MDWHWLAYRYAEIAHLPEGEQRSFVQAAMRRMRRDVRTWVFPLIPNLLLAAQLWAMTHWPSMAITGLVGLTAFIVVVAAQFVTWWYHSQAVRRTIRDELLRRGVRPARCFDCGYDLRAMASDRCPECGTPIAPNLA
jgi:hypothetical protein